MGVELRLETAGTRFWLTMVKIVGAEVQEPDGE